MKLEELRRFNDSGYLSLQEEEGKVYINWKEVNPVLYGSASNVEECINIMQNTMFVYSNFACKVTANIGYHPAITATNI